MRGCAPHPAKDKSLEPFYKFCGSGGSSPQRVQGRALTPPAQCAISNGNVWWRSSERLTPPTTASRSRDWP